MVLSCRSCGFPEFRDVPIFLRTAIGGERMTRAVVTSVGRENVGSYVLTGTKHESGQTVGYAIEEGQAQIGIWRRGIDECGTRLT